MTFATATITSPTPAKDLMAALNTSLVAGGLTFVETYGTPTSMAWNAITFGGGQYVALVPGTTTAATSPDGITWTQRTLPAVSSWSGVAYGGGMYVAVASGANIAATSPDGITWTQRALPAFGTWSAVTYGGGQFVALCSSTAIAATSPDGITWTQRTLPVSQTWSCVVYGGTQFVALCSNTTANGAVTSPDGITWTARTTTTANATSVCWSGTQFVAVCTATAVAMTSPDGITWTNRVLPASTGWNSVTYSGSLYVAVSTAGGIAATSADGQTNWVQRALPLAVTHYVVAYGAGVFTALGTGAPTGAATSADGITWTARSMTPTSASAVADVYKSPAASNQFGQDWYLILKRSSDTNAALVYQVAEGYNATTHRASNYGGIGSLVIPVAGTFANPLYPVTPELSPAGSAAVGLSNATPFTFWVSASANRVVVGVKTNSESGFYAGLYDDLLPAGVTGFPLVCAKMPPDQVLGNAIGGTTVQTTGGFTREPGQTLAATNNFEARISNQWQPATGAITPGNFTPMTTTAAIYGNVVTVARVMLGTARTATVTADALRGLLIGCVSTSALTVIGDTVTSGGKTYVRMAGPTSSYGIFADSSL